MTKKERLVMRYLCEICPKKRTYLVSPHDIAIALSKRFVLSTSEIDEIMQELSFENYIDFNIDSTVIENKIFKSG